jgi:hypothetical protein
MRVVLYTVVILVLGLFVATTCVDFANAIEPTTLEEALERPVKVQKWVDKPNNVVCYWLTRYPKYLTCLQRRGLPQHNADVR